jgi:hypothetical protein
MAVGKTLLIRGHAAAIQNAQNGHQQQQSLRLTDNSALAAFWEGLLEGDQISSGCGVSQRTGAAPTNPPPA